MGKAKKNKNLQKTVNNAENEVVEVVEENNVNENDVKVDAKENDQPKQSEKKNKKTKKAKKSEPKTNKVKETVSELKKVSWPTFAKVVKNTLLVLGIVLIFTVVLFGIDFGLSKLFGLLIPSAS